jgi:hypothetical protein
MRKFAERIGHVVLKSSQSLRCAGLDARGYEKRGVTHAIAARADSSSAFIAIRYGLGP